MHRIQPSRAHGGTAASNPRKAPREAPSPIKDNRRSRATVIEQFHPRELYRYHSPWTGKLTYKRTYEGWLTTICERFALMARRRGQEHAINQSYVDGTLLSAEQTEYLLTSARPRPRGRHAIRSATRPT